MKRRGGRGGKKTGVERETLNSNKSTVTELEPNELFPEFSTETAAKLVASGVSRDLLPFVMESDNTFSEATDTDFLKLRRIKSQVSQSQNIPSGNNISTTTEANQITQPRFRTKYDVWDGQFHTFHQFMLDFEQFLKIYPNANWHTCILNMLKKEEINKLTLVKLDTTKPWIDNKKLVISSLNPNYYNVLEQKLHNWKVNPNENISTILIAFESIVNNLNIGFQSETVAYSFLNGFPFLVRAEIKKVCFAKGTNEKSFIQLKEIVFNMFKEQRYVFTNKREFNNLSNVEKSNNVEKPFKKKDTKDITCFRCKRSGHTRNDCFATKDKEGIPLKDPPPKSKPINSKTPRPTNIQSNKFKSGFGKSEIKK
jgi:hypothetical protein